MCKEDKYCTLMYHDAYINKKNESGFDTPSASSYKILASTFENQVMLIKEYCIKYKISQDYVRFSFDDGGESFYTIFAPILEKYGYKGYFFISTKYIGQNGFLNKGQILELYKRGHYIGSHSHSHKERMHIWSKEDIKKDWCESLQYLSDIVGQSIQTVSLPNGFCSDVLLDVLIELGVKEIYTSDPYEKIKYRKDVKIYGRYGIKDNMKDVYVLQIVNNNYIKFYIRLKKKILDFFKKILGKYYLKIRSLIFKNQI